MGVPDPAKSSPAGLQLGEKVVVLLGGMTAGMALTVLTPVLPVIEKALAHTPTEQMLVKQLFGITTLAMVVGASLGGFLAARVGMRWLLLIASALFAIGGSAGYFLSSLPLLLVSRACVGVSAACIQILVLSLINTRLDGTGRAKWVGLHIASATLFSLVIFPLSGFLAEINWRLPFFIHLLGFAVMITTLVSPAREFPAAPAPGPPGKTAESVFSWMPWHYVVLALFTGAITFMPTIYAPFLLAERAGLKPSAIGGIMLFNAVLGGASAIFYGRAMRYLTIHRAFLISFALIATGMFIVSQSHGLVTFLTGYVINDIGTAWVVPNFINSLGAKVQPYRQAKAAGLVKSGQFISTPICILLVDPYARQFGAGTVMLIASGVAALLFILMLLRTLSSRGTTQPPVRGAATTSVG